MKYHNKLISLVCVVCIHCTRNPGPLSLPHNSCVCSQSLIPHVHRPGRWQIPCIVEKGAGHRLCAESRITLDLATLLKGGIHGKNHFYFSRRRRDLWLWAVMLQQFICTGVHAK